MREAAIPDYRLYKAKRSTRVLVTLGLLGLFLALVSALALTVFKTGLSPEEVRIYYIGSSDSSDSLDAMLAPTTGRPVLELLEITHLHLMGGAILLFLLCHLLALCGISDKLRISLYLITFSSFLATFAVPWLIIFVDPIFSYLFAPSALTSILSIFICMVIPIKEMWLRN